MACSPGIPPPPLSLSLSPSLSHTLVDWRISHCPDGAINSLWRTYISWDPLFIRVPPFLRIMCSIEVFVFGPSYALMALALRQPAPPRWFPGFALAFSGALLYSTAVFFTYEVLFAPRDFVNLPMVCLVNAPWSLLPLALGTRALELIRAAQLLGPTSPRGIIGCFNSDKWS